MSALDRPIFVVCPPCSGEGLLAAALFAAPGTWTAGDGPAALLAGAPELDAAGRADGDRLMAEHAAEAGAAVREQLVRRYESLDMTGRPRDAEPRLFDAVPRNSLRIPFLDAVFDEPTFVYLSRRPADALAESFALWRSGEAVTHPDLDGWSGPPWSLLLVPGWPDLNGCELAEIVVEQWTRTASILLDDLAELPADRWCVADYDALLAEPEDEVQRLFRFLGVGWHSHCSAPFRAAGAARRNTPPPPELEPLLDRTDAVAGRAAEWIAPRQTESAAPGTDRVPTTTDSGLGPLLQRLRSSLVVTTYQTNRLAVIHGEDGSAAALFRSFERPMGIAAHDGGFALGTRAQVLDYRDFPAVAQGLEPAGTPRRLLPAAQRATHRRHRDPRDGVRRRRAVARATRVLVPGDPRRDHSFVPRWKPPFVSELAAEDRCHLNGLAIVDGRAQVRHSSGRSRRAGRLARATRPTAAS